MEHSLLMLLFTILSLLPLQCCHATESIIIISLPHIDNEEAVTSWERGTEILPGADRAVESINTDPHILKDTDLIVATANSGMISKDEPYSGNVLEIVANLTWQNKSVFGIAGLFHPNTLLALQAFQLPIVSLVHFGGTSSSPNVLHITSPSSVLVKSVIAFVSAINQTRIGVISENNHLYYSQISNDLVTKTNVSLLVQVSGSHQKSLSGVVDKIYNSNVHVVFLSARPSVIFSILLEACKRGFQWPNYAWILHSLSLRDLRQFESNNSVCSKSHTLEGMILLQLNTQEPANFHQENNGTLQPANPFSFLLHDAVYALALLADNKSSTHLQDNAALAQSVLYRCGIAYSNVSFYQVSNLNVKYVGIYSSTSNKLSNFSIGTLNFAFDGLILLRNAPNILVLTLPALAFFINTLFLILFICFRNHPDVKSTNVSLSLQIFIACYLLIGYTIATFVYVSFGLEVCMLTQWISGLGLSASLILATILVKMLQIYHIFTLLRRIKPSFYTKHIAPVAYTLLITSLHIVILTLWNIIDPFYIVHTHAEHPGFMSVSNTCICTYPQVWYGLFLLYLLFLCSIVVCVAIKTRKIRIARFKDTKKVNLFIFLIILTAIKTFAYWYTIFALDRNSILRIYVLIFGHAIAVFVIQFTLFLPKIWTPLVERLKLLKSVNALNSISVQTHSTE